MTRLTRRSLTFALLGAAAGCGVQTQEQVMAKDDIDPKSIPD